MKNCVICEKGGEKVVLETDRGKASLKEFSQLRQNNIVLSCLEKNEEVHVHKNCCKWYNNKKRIESEQRKLNLTEEISSKATRTATQSFNWRLNCFICGLEIKIKEDSHVVQTLDLKTTILNDCESHLAICQDEVWAMDVKGRVTQCFDLVSSGATYHQNCRVKFSTSKK